ncbi:DUF2845 domain-containing protein [Anaeromyxobacter oryzae]|uniref:DUF2845 domain-containing protein n=1 Tax=Anaeromyxobacter oryzae TaxID=2918170 RepID=A0ABM7X2D3_9BACT|nr:DUF2845 domain-containing protein [Anaeromyxobacter oryzae]BDG05960.1 hypothetical protein AMOR_49560 [Anaeromyxobacter oryzae]
MLARTRTLVLAGSIVALCAILGPQRAVASESSLSCDGGIVAVGDTRVDLLGKCGEPALREARPASTSAIVVSGQPPAVTGASVSAIVEQWTYNFGPGRFLMTVTLEAGKVMLIERGGYGYEPARVGTTRTAPGFCDTSRVRPGDLKLDVLARCGEPTTKDTRREKRPVPIDGPSGGTATAFVTVEVEVWTYDAGPQRFISIVTLENGKVAAVDRGGYGYRR